MLTEKDVSFIKTHLDELLVLESTIRAMKDGLCVCVCGDQSDLLSVCLFIE